MEEWHSALDKHCCVHAVFLDAVKTFDRIDHAVLLTHLAEIGVSGTALKWFRSYMNGSHIRVKVQGSLSECCLSLQEYLRGPSLAHCCFSFIL